jgi:tetratricopeptide (TPR) repeat protein
MASQNPRRPAPSLVSRRVLLASLALAALVAAIYYPVAGYEFIGCDDPATAEHNPAVVHGLSERGLREALCNTHVGFWLPATFLSLALDHEISGMDPGRFHVTNAVLFALGAVVFFRALHLLTGAFWPSFAAALLFAAHPLRVESVAWITERKDVLCGLFWFLCLLAYARYARTQKVLDYLLVALCLLLALMSKPMAVTLPFVLLLLDYWPLRRLDTLSGQGQNTSRLRPVLEKIPLLALSAGFSLITVRAHSGVGALAPLSDITLSGRLANMLCAYGTALEKTLWPANLAMLYPRADPPLLSAPVLGSALVLAAITAASVLARKKAPFLPVGWFIFLGALFPVSGVMQAGVQAFADRFTFFSHTGAAVMAAFGAASIAAALGRRRSGVPAALGVVLAVTVAALGVSSALQTRYWKDSITLFTRTLSLTRDNWFVEHLAGTALVEKKRFKEAEPHLRRSVSINPEFAGARVSLGNALSGTGKTSEALEEYRQALRLSPGYGAAYCSMAMLYEKEGDYAEAEKYYIKVLDTKENVVTAHNNLGGLLTRRNDFLGAADHYTKALETDPTLAETHYNLGKTYKSMGRYKEAYAKFTDALSRDPKYSPALNGLGKLLSETGKPSPALRFFRAAAEADPGRYENRFDLGILLIAQSQHQEALYHLEKAGELAPKDPAVWTAQGNALLGLGRKAEAAERYRRALALAAEDAEAPGGLEKALETEK